jgi:hypothetical protein
MPHLSHKFDFRANETSISWLPRRLWSS